MGFSTGNSHSGFLCREAGGYIKIFVPSMDDKLSLQGYTSTLQCICTGSCAAVNQSIEPYGYQWYLSRR